MRTRDLVALGRLPHRAYGTSPSEADHAAIAWAMQETETVAFAERAADRLSAGERARVLLARALAVRAPVYSWTSRSRCSIRIISCRS